MTRYGLGTRTVLGTLLVGSALIGGPLLLNDADTTALAGGESNGDTIGFGTESYFAKYDGIDGEASDANHDNWIDILAIDWGAQKPTSRSGSTRRRAAPRVNNMVMTMCYEKSTPKLAEKMLKGEVIPKLEIEVESEKGEEQATYLRYELKNVLITSYAVSGNANASGPPTVVVGNNFEEIKVTYTEYSNQGGIGGNVEFSYKKDK